jgi:hypothetical protein
VPKKAPKLAQALEVPEDLQQHLTNSSEPYLAMTFGSPMQPRYCARKNRNQST